MMWHLITGMGTRLVAVDIGSVRPPSKFVWAAFDAPGRELIEAGEDPETAVSVLASGLLAGAQAALLLEAPMAVPVPGSKPDGWHGQESPVRGRATGHGRQEPGPGHWRPGWHKGAWMLRQLAATVPGPTATRQPGSWRRGGARLLPAEAFITGAGKPGILPAGQHAADAAAAGLALVELLDSPDTLVSAVGCSPQESFGLLTAMALWAELRIDPDELRAEVLVVAGRPQPRPWAATSASTRASRRTEMPMCARSAGS
jgi:hypothetical protein